MPPSSARRCGIPGGITDHSRPPMRSLCSKRPTRNPAPPRAARNRPRRGLLSASGPSSRHVTYAPETPPPMMATSSTAVSSATGVASAPRRARMAGTFHPPTEATAPACIVTWSRRRRLSLVMSPPCIAGRPVRAARATVGSRSQPQVTARRPCQFHPGGSTPCPSGHVNGRPLVGSGHHLRGRRRHRRDALQLLVRDHPEALQPPQVVGHRPDLGNLAALDAEEPHADPFRSQTGGRHASLILDVALLRPHIALVGGDHVALGNHLLDGDLQVRVILLAVARPLLRAAGLRLLARRRIVVDDIG